MLETCQAKGVPAALERSRSGNGGHVWIFFSEPVSARTARQLGAAMLTEAMERRPEIGFASYDRLFPSQDTMPVGGFGNLIALPLQRRAREFGNSVFVDQDLRPYDDQWAFLAARPRLSAKAAAEIVDESETRGRILGVRMPVEDEDADEPWRMTPSRRPKARPVGSPLSGKITIVVADQLYIDRADLPAATTARLIRLAAFQNPEFYRAQSMRFPTFGKPRIISCAELHRRHVGLPRGCLDEAVELIRAEGAEVELNDLRVIRNPLASRVRFQGTVYEPQVKAFEALLPHENGVLAATTAFGKTVVAAALIAQRGSNALVLVHRRELLTQWVERLRTFLDIDPKDVGVIGAGRRKPTGIIDVALIQSLVRRGEISDIVADYGHLVVDECHQLSAASFELVARRAKARYVLGLSATVARKDGHHPIIFMQCGPVRHRVDARAYAAGRGIVHRVTTRSTQFQLPPPLAWENRTVLPCRRSMRPSQGGMSAAERKVSDAGLRVADDQERLVLATGRYIGEGFDDPRLDALFLTMPISWKGTLAQYVGRLHRQHAGKTEVLVVDYVDDLVPILARMAAKRRSGYRALGYTVESSASATEPGGQS